jgi:hypothetical protein
MWRLLAPVLAVLLLAGCGLLDSERKPPVAAQIVQQPDAGAGPISSRQRSYPATTACGFERSAERSGITAPPTPLIRARLEGDRIIVDYELLAAPAGCKPVAIVVRGSSVEDLGNMAPGEGDGSPTPLSGLKGTEVLKLPPLDLPPYQVNAALIAENGMRGTITTVPVPDDRDYCRRRKPLDTCKQLAQEKFERCLRGEEPREACPDYVYRARPPLAEVPLRDITIETLEASFAYMARRGEQGGVHFAKVACQAEPWGCLASWTSRDGDFVAHYLIQGDKHKAGCWQSERDEILRQPPDREGWVPDRYLINDHISACVDWVER